jgi:hypothetical protein
MTIYDQNKQAFPDLDQLKTANNTFLKDIYLKASKYLLSPRQISAAQAALAQEKAFGGLTPYDVNKKAFPQIDALKKLILTKNDWYNDFIDDVLNKANRYILSPKQISVLEKEYDKLSAPKEELSDEQRIFYEALLHYFDRFSDRYSNNGFIAQGYLLKIKNGEFNESDKKSMFKMVHKFKKSVFTFIFGDNSSSSKINNYF